MGQNRPITFYITHINLGSVKHYHLALPGQSPGEALCASKRKSWPQRAARQRAAKHRRRGPSRSRFAYCARRVKPIGDLTGRGTDRHGGAYRRAQGNRGRGKAIGEGEGPETARKRPAHTSKGAGRPPYSGTTVSSPLAPFPPIGIATLRALHGGAKCLAPFLPCAQRQKGPHEAGLPDRRSQTQKGPLRGLSPCRLKSNPQGQNQPSRPYASCPRIPFLQSRRNARST